MTEQTIERLSNNAGQPTSEAPGISMPSVHHPPLGFPSDLELTRMASEMFASCDEFGPSPFAVESEQRLPTNIQGRPFAATPPSPIGLGLPVTADTIPSPFAFLDNPGSFSTGFPDERVGARRQTASEVEPLSLAHSPKYRGEGTEQNHKSTSKASLPGTGGLRGFNPSLTPSNLPQRRVGAFDPELVRRDFPILSEVVHGKPLVWLDNAATTQKPQAVIDRLSHFYLHENSNVHRAAHELARRSTDAFEAARESVARFINAQSSDNIVFVRGTTEAINLVAQSFGRQNIAAGDEIIVTHLEHHANIVPWQQLCAEKKARLLVAPVDDHGQIRLDEYRKLFSHKTRFVSLSQVSNALGTITPAREMVEMAHRLGVPVLLDGAQSVSHMRVDVQSLNCDFFVFSGHKVFAPTGIGVLYGKEKLLNDMPPWHGGGNMIQDVTFEKTVYHAAPMRFEAGTGNIADAVGLHAAIDYVQKIGLETIARYEHDLLAYGTNELTKIPGLRIIGTAAEKAGVLSFVVAGVPTETIGKALSNEGIAVRSGHHCAQPILRRFGLESTVRASLALYNTTADIDRLVSVVRSAVEH